MTDEPTDEEHRAAADAIVHDGLHLIYDIQLMLSYLVRERAFRNRAEAKCKELAGAWQAQKPLPEGPEWPLQRKMHEAMRSASKSALLAKLAELAKSDDTEVAHCEADSALIAYIDDPEIEAAYERIGKWYS